MGRWHVNKSVEMFHMYNIIISVKSNLNVLFSKDCLHTHTDSDTYYGQTQRHISRPTHTPMHAHTRTHTHTHTHKQILYYLQIGLA